MTDDRDSNGHFKPGHGVKSAGNPMLAKMNKFRYMLASSITDEDFIAVVKALTKTAKRGDVFACKLLLAYTVGRPLDSEEVDGDDRKRPIIVIEGMRIERPPEAPAPGK